MSRYPFILLFIVSIFMLSGCADTEDDIQKASAVISATAGNDVHGIVTFTKTETGIKIQATMTGLTSGDHGFHIHQFGDISRPDGKSAGGHFNPTGHNHASPDSKQRHVGDLGNISADSTGYAYYERHDSKLTFSGKNNIIGRALIVHAGTDDTLSQPTGAAGARVGQGVIGIAAKTR